MVEIGTAVYRGQTLKPHHLSSQQLDAAQRILQSKPRRRDARPAQRTSGQHKDRITTFVWNSGKLPFHEFVHWLRDGGHKYDIIIVVETRIPRDMEHTHVDYKVLHSAAAHAGILIMIHNRLAAATRITWRTVEAGRTLHAKVHGQRSNLNIIGFYQQAWQPQNIPGCKKRRREVLQKLETVLQECSKNQIVILGGDFNTEVGPWKNLVRQSPTPGRADVELKPQDWPDLRDLMDKHRLCAGSHHVPGMASHIWGHWARRAACQDLH